MREVISSRNVLVDVSVSGVERKTLKSPIGEIVMRELENSELDLVSGGMNKSDFVNAALPPPPPPPSVS